jgi:hypothetical protein
MGNDIFSCFSYFGSSSGVFEISEGLCSFRTDGNKIYAGPLEHNTMQN